VSSCLLFAAVYNAPRFLEFSWTTEYDLEAEAERARFEVTDLRKDPYYIVVYVTWMYLVFMYFVPFVSLAVLNLLIFLEIRKVRKKDARCDWRAVEKSGNEITIGIRVLGERGLSTSYSRMPVKGQ